MTMSHPGAISCRCNLIISRRRRRIRLRRTALPSAFFMLQPKRLLSRPLGRRNSVNSRLLRRRPSRYTASYSTRRSRRKTRGKSRRVAPSDAREAVAPFFAASCKNFPSTLRFHALAKPVLLMAAPHMRLKSAFRQRSSPSQFIATRALRRIAGPVETSSLDDLRATVKEPRRVRIPPARVARRSIDCVGVIRRVAFVNQLLNRDGIQLRTVLLRKGEHLSHRFALLAIRPGGAQRLLLCSQSSQRFGDYFLDVAEMPGFQFVLDDFFLLGIKFDIHRPIPAASNDP